MLHVTACLLQITLLQCEYNHTLIGTFMKLKEHIISAVRLVIVSRITYVKSNEAG